MKVIEQGKRQGWRRFLRQCGMAVLIVGLFAAGAQAKMRIVDIEGSEIYIDRAGSPLPDVGKRFEVFDQSGKKRGLVKITRVDATEVVATVLRGGDFEPGFELKAQPKFEKIVGIWYTPLSFDNGYVSDNGLRAMISATFHSTSAPIFGLEVGLGYMDVVEMDGFAFRVDGIAQIELTPDVCFFTLGAGAGVVTQGGDSTSTESDSQTDGRGFWEGFGGIRLHPVRQLGVNFRVVYMEIPKGYDPEVPTFMVGLEYLFN